MKHTAPLLFILFLSYGCATAPTATSTQVMEYKSVEEMNSFTKCNALGPVNATYDVTMHSPAGRKRAAHIQLKDAAYAKDGNAVIMVSNNWGVVTDQVQGIAYKCVYGQ